MIPSNPAAIRRVATRFLAPLALGVALTSACDSPEPDPQIAPPAVQTMDLEDTLKARRERALATRPDTFGGSADEGRITAGDAKVVVVVTNDFQCPRCERFTRDILKDFREQYVATGKVRLAFVNYPLSQYFNSREAAITGLCAARAGKFWETHDALFATLPTWERMPDPRPYMDSLAIAAGVPDSTQRDCITKYRMLALLSRDIERSRTAGATNPPVVFVDDVKLEGKELTAGALRKAVEAALERAGAR